MEPAEDKAPKAPDKMAQVAAVVQIQPYSLDMTLAPDQAGILRDSQTHIASEYTAILNSPDAKGSLTINGKQGWGLREKDGSVTIDYADESISAQHTEILKKDQNGIHITETMTDYLSPDQNRQVDRDYGNDGLLRQRSVAHPNKHDYSSAHFDAGRPMDSYRSSDTSVLEMNGNHQTINETRTIAFNEKGRIDSDVETKRVNGQDISNDSTVVIDRSGIAERHINDSKTRLNTGTIEQVAATGEHKWAADGTLLYEHEKTDRSDFDANGNRVLRFKKDQAQQFDPQGELLTSQSSATEDSYHDEGITEHSADISRSRKDKGKYNTISHEVMQNLDDPKKTFDKESIDKYTASASGVPLTWEPIEGTGVVSDGNRQKAYVVVPGNDQYPGRWVPEGKQNEAPPPINVPIVDVSATSNPNSPPTENVKNVEKRVYKSSPVLP